MKCQYFAKYERRLPVIEAIAPEVAKHVCKLQNRDQQKPDRQPQQHAVGDAHVKHKPEQHRQQEGRAHARGKVPGDFLVVFQNGVIDHHRKDQRKRQKGDKAGKHVIRRHLPHDQHPQVERNGDQRGEGEVQRDADNGAGAHVVNLSR